MQTVMARRELLDVLAAVLKRATTKADAFAQGCRVVTNLATDGGPGREAAISVCVTQRASQLRGAAR
jgi:hypothetical protein